MHELTSSFRLAYTTAQYQDAVAYVEDMKRHPQRIFWIGKKNLNDMELVHSVLTHRILSGFYNLNSGRYTNDQIIEMKSL